MALVGVLPQGFPPFTVPDVGLSDIGLLFGGALGIALVSLTDTISTASSFAARAGDEIDGQREMIGIGASNIAAGFFQGFPVSTSGSRTAVAEQAGAKTQLTGLIGAAAITLILLFFPGLLRDLPQPTLAAVVIAASLSLADIPATQRLYRVRRSEFLLSIAAFLGVVLLGVLPGIALAVALSIANVFRRAWWPYQTVLGRVPGLPGYHDVRSYPDAELLPNCVVFRFDAPLFFANSRTFREQIRALAARRAPSLVDHRRRRADHRRRHHRRRHAPGPRRGAERPWHQPGLRRDEGSGAAQDRALRAHPDDRSGPLLPDAHCRHHAFRTETGAEWQPPAPRGARHQRRPAASGRRRQRCLEPGQPTKPATTPPRSRPAPRPAVTSRGCARRRHTRIPPRVFRRPWEPSDRSQISAVEGQPDPGLSGTA